MNAWLKRGIISASLASALAVGGYLFALSTRGRPAPTFEDLIELADLETVKPGGRAMTKTLVEACGLEPDMQVLDIGCASGDTALFLAGTFGAMVTGIDPSEKLIETARGKAAAAGLETRLSFIQADPYRLPFKRESFDVVTAEFVTSGLDKSSVLPEWTRVIKSGGCLGIHDIVWLQEPPAELRERAEVSLGLVPETLTDWIDAFRKAGLVRMQAMDVTDSWTEYSLRVVRGVGWGGLMRTASRLTSLYGANAVKVLPALLKNEWYNRLSLLGYAVIVGCKP
ncbi:MAG: class I SAM-dependent methyltransferase [Candidatus Aquicultorales bacterium]